ncbi:hypothetical protein ZIOFF_032895 [Zingiber officinale]|uniref:Uncharacterized protein n=1 Tax=Zingiber officinale TaxID=94328 RepID=A0A8J5L6P4_ZINOF|nr:hypothetical protein ZIOFF_032895 [Zingiber officinale]
MWPRSTAIIAPVSSLKMTKLAAALLLLRNQQGNIQISILARGYEAWQHGEANLLLTRGLVGRLSNTPNVGFAYEVQNVVDYLASSGIRALPGRRYKTRDSRTKLDY